MARIWWTDLGAESGNSCFYPVGLYICLFVLSVFVITLVTLVWPFSTLYSYHMPLSNVWTKGCKVTLVTFWSSKCLHNMILNHTGCICLTTMYFHMPLQNSMCSHNMILNHTGCIFFTFLHYVFSYASSKRLNKRMQSHNGCICLPILNFVSSYVL